jgi:hypothetical protein
MLAKLIIVVLVLIPAYQGTLIAQEGRASFELSGAAACQASSQQHACVLNGSELSASV